nr:MAG TPA: hypothetical protein [Caudoviricetes sp.]DAK66494.1 MAG TPA: hypothetical protein [Caudoviricetes sp.]DAR47642.1 MAG TPA: hypothetical protein [Bacteriophage sp.]DAT83787.1 MAG TPA: hypothetical protein [Caudoviricetes sp.]DAU08768.1 MAG TPA: hypothetical protein [Caudoviricetes sp.]
MVKLSKKEWNEIKESGFTTKYRVFSTSHNRYYYMAEPDFRNYNNWVRNNGKKV